MTFGCAPNVLVIVYFVFLCARNHSMVNRTWLKQNIYRKRCKPKTLSVGKESLMAYVAPESVTAKAE